MRMIIFPFECFADMGVSIKVFMPFLYYKLLMLACKIFGLGKLTRLHSDRFTKRDLPFHDKNGFPVSALHMNVDWGVVVAIEEEFESVFGEYCRHCIFFLR